MKNLKHSSWLPYKHLNAVIKNELITDSKLTKSSKKSEKSNTKRVTNENKNETHIDPKQSAPLQKNNDNASTKENAANSEDNSSTKSRDINSRSRKSIVILHDSMLKHLMTGKC